MRGCLCVLLSVAIFSSVVAGEIGLQFDGEEWNLPEGVGELTEDALKAGVCFMADANVPVGVALEGMGLDQLLSHPVRFALRGQEGKGARLDAIPPDKVEAKNVITIICDEGEVTAMCVALDRENIPIPDSANFGTMDDDFVGVESFLKAIKDGVKKTKDAGEVPRMVLVVRSKTSYGHMVRMLQLARAAGCQSGLVRVDDEFPSLNFKIQIDPNVLPPVKNVRGGDETGRIVVNIREDGTLTDGEMNVLDGEGAVVAYVERERKVCEEKGLKPKLHLRGASDSVFKHSRQVIAWANKAGVDKVVFAVYQVAKKEVEELPKAREQDLGMELPEMEDDLLKQADKADVFVEVVIDEKGRISIGKEEVFLDTDAEERELPLLKARLETVAKVNGIAAREMGVSMRVDEKATQQRVIDVLNVLSGFEIKNVTFVEMEEGE